MNRTRLRLLAGLGAFALVLPACVPADVGYSDVRRLTSERAAKDVRWREFDGDGPAERRTREILQKPLTADDAIQVALLNNRGLQAAFEDLGLARAGLVRALRIPNPTAHGAVLFGHSDRPELDVRVLQNISDLVVMPWRKGAANSELEAAKASVVGAVLDVAFAARAAFYEHQAAVQLLELQGTVLDATAASYEAAKGLHDAGNITDLALATERALYEESRIAKARAEAEVVASREKLAALLGVPTPRIAFTLAPRLAELPPAEIPLDSLERNAVEKSLDLALTRHRFEAAAKRANYSRFRGVLPEIGVGVEAERREDWGFGPAAAVSVPLFYQGQGEVAEAVAEMRRERETYADIAFRVRAASRGVIARLTTLRASVAYFRDVLVPLRNDIVEGAQLEYNAMSIGVFQLLQAKRDQIASARQYVEGLRDYWLVRAEAETLLAGRLPRGLVSSRTTPGGTTEMAVPAATDAH